MNIFILLPIACMLAIVFIFLRKATRITRKKSYSNQERKTIDMYGYLPKAADRKYIVLAFILMTLIALKSDAQVFVFGGAGVSNKYFSAELQAGYRYQNYTASIGYIALPERTQPALFNVRAGYVIAERVHVYAGYVKVMYSLDDKSRNSNTWQVGTQYLFSHYDRGSFYIGANYTGNKMLSAHVGMTFNLVKTDY